MNRAMQETFINFLINFIKDLLLKAKRNNAKFYTKFLFSIYSKLIPFISKDLSINDFGKGVASYGALLRKGSIRDRDIYQGP